MKLKFNPASISRYVALFVAGVLLFWLIALLVPWHFIGEENSKKANAEILLRNQASVIAKAYSNDKELARATPARFRLCLQKSRFIQPGMTMTGSEPCW